MIKNGSELNKSQSGIIHDFQGDEQLVARLKELGLHTGLQIQNVGQSPFRGPQLFSIGATVIALRKEEAECILINLN